MISGFTTLFRRAWAFFAPHEGSKLEKVAGDRGGLTKYGVDQASHPHVNIAALTEQAAAQIYHDAEWTRCRCEELPDAWAIALFDFAANSGMGTAAKKLQTAVGVKPDGFIGPVTIAAVKAARALDLQTFLDLREQYLRAASRRAGQAGFCKGWLARVADMRVYVKDVPGGTAGAAAGSVAMGKAAASKLAGSIGLAPTFGLALMAGAGTVAHALLAQSKPEPSPEALKEWVATFAYLLGIVLLVVNLVKSFRPDPSADKKYATKGEMDRVDKDAVERDRVRGERIAHVERSFGAKHTENVRRLEDVVTKLEANRAEDHKERAKLREDVRHDVRQELSPINNKIDGRAEDAEDQFRKLATEIGGLTASKDANNQMLAEMRHTLGVLLSRTGGQQGGNQV